MWVRESWTLRGAECRRIAKGESACVRGRYGELLTLENSLTVCEPTTAHRSSKT